MKPPDFILEAWATMPGCARLNFAAKEVACGNAEPDNRVSMVELEGMTRSHRSWATATDPDAGRKTFAICDESGDVTVWAATFDA